MPARLAPRLPWGCLAVALAIAAGPGPARAGDAGPPGLDRLLAALAAAAPGRVRFTEERHLELLTVPVRLSGTLSFVPPARLERHVLMPREERWTIDGDQVEVETPAAGDRSEDSIVIALSDHAPLAALVTGLRAILAGDAAALAAVYTIALDGGAGDADRAGWSLRLTPRPATFREAVQEVRLDGTGSGIATIEVIETDGDRTLIRIDPGR